MFRPLLAALVCTAVLAGPALAETTMTVTSDTGAVAPRTIRECPVAKPPNEPLACPTIFEMDRPELLTTNGRAVTFRFTDPPSPPRLRLTDTDGPLVGAPAWVQVDPLTYRLTFPAGTPDRTLATVTLEEDGPTATTPLRIEAFLRHQERASRTRLLAASRRAAGGSRVAFTTSEPGTVRLEWQALGRRGARTIEGLRAGRYTVRLAVPRAARRVRITASLDPTSAARTSAAVRTFTLERG